MARDLNKPVNEYLKFFDQYNRTTVFVILVIVCVFFSVDSFLRSGRSVDISNAANAKVDYELHATRAELTATKNRISLWIVYIQRLHNEMILAGLDPPPLPEE